MSNEKTSWISLLSLVYALNVPLLRSTAIPAACTSAVMRGAPYTPRERWCEVSWVLFLGIYLDFYYFPRLILFSQRVFNLNRDAVPQALMQSYLIPP